MKLLDCGKCRDKAALVEARNFISQSASTSPIDFVPPTMSVRTETCVWDDPLSPVPQMNLTEG